jgi:hypothetical protein
VLFLLASLISATAVLPQAHDTDVHLTAVAVLLTLIYVTGLISRSGRRIARSGLTPWPCWSATRSALSDWSSSRRDEPRFGGTRRVAG